MMYEAAPAQTSKGPLLSIEDYLAVIRARKWLVVALTLIGLVAAIALANQRTPAYEATSTVLVNPSPVASSNANLVAPNLDREVEVLVGDEIRELTRAKLTPDTSEQVTDAQLSDDLKVAFSVGSDVMRITFSSTDPDVAAETANAFAGAYIERRLAEQVGFYDEQLAALTENIGVLQADYDRWTAEIVTLDAQRADISRTLSATTQATERALQLEANTFSRQTAVTAQNAVATDLRALRRTEADLRSVREAQAPAGQVLSTAFVPGSPRGLGTLPIAITGLVLGLIAGVSVASLTERLDRTANEPEDVAAVLDTQVLGTIPQHLGWRHRRSPENLIMRSENSNAKSHEAREAFRRLRTAVEYLMRVDDIKTLIITSSNPGEGKSLTSANLAVALASRGVRVALINADMRRPTLEVWFGQSNAETGLSGYLGGLGDDLGPILFDDIPRLALITAGPAPSNPGDLLASDRFTNLLKELGDQVDLILLDTPPIGAAADAAAASPAVDGVLLMVDAKATSTEELRRTRADLERAGGTIVGAVLNRYRSRESGRYGRRSYY